MENRQGWIDSLRLCAGLSMIGLHATADANGQAWPNSATADRVVPMLLRSILYLARTELFILIAVFLLLLSLERRPRNWAQTMLEQISRLAPPFLFWTVFFAAYSLLKARTFGYEDAYLERFLDPFQWFEFLILGTAKYHMHFLPTLIGVILLFPAYRLAVRFPILGLGLFLTLYSRQEIDFYLWANFHENSALPWVLRVVKIICYGGYGLAAGSLLGLWHRHRESVCDAAALIFLLGGCLFLVKLTATGIAIETGRWPFEYRPGYWADYLMPLTLFLGLMSQANRRFPSLLSRCAKYSFGLYLCHPIFLDLAELLSARFAWSPISIILFKIALTLPTTALLVWAIGKSPLLSWTIGLRHGDPKPEISTDLGLKP